MDHAPVTTEELRRDRDLDETTHTDILVGWQKWAKGQAQLIDKVKFLGSDIYRGTLALFRCATSMSSQTRTYHDIKIRQDLTVYTDMVHDEASAMYEPDPLHRTSFDAVYLQDETPHSVSTLLSVLGLEPKWEDICPAGQHEYVFVTDYYARHGYDDLGIPICKQCNTMREFISYAGHSVPCGTIEKRYSSVMVLDYYDELDLPCVTSESL